MTIVNIVVLPLCWFNSQQDVPWGIKAWHSDSTDTILKLRSKNGQEVEITVDSATLDKLKEQLPIRALEMRRWENRHVQ